MPKQKLDIPIPPVSPDEAQRIVRTLDEALKRFKGQIEELEGAIGMYFVGRLMGWRVLVLIHNKRTIKKYEEILGISIRDEFRETAPFTEKSLGYLAVQRLNAFWKAVSGELSVEKKRELQKS